MKRSRTRNRTPRTATPAIDTNLLAALDQLAKAVTDLCAGHPSRYTQLCAAMYGTRGGAGSHALPSQLIPVWIDALKLKLTIDHRTHAIASQCHTTPRNPPPAIKDTRDTIKTLLQRTWRPQDANMLVTAATEIGSWAKAIDDLFAPKPIYLPNPCPQCGQNHTYRNADTGERVRSYALTINTETGATCLACHATWPPNKFVFLGRLLGTTDIPA
jgi:hypothetical protein